MRHKVLEPSAVLGPVTAMIRRSPVIHASAYKWLALIWGLFWIMVSTLPLPPHLASIPVALVILPGGLLLFIPPLERWLRGRVHVVLHEDGVVVHHPARGQPWEVRLLPRRFLRFRGRYDDLRMFEYPEGRFMLHHHLWQMDVTPLGIRRLRPLFRKFGIDLTHEGEVIATDTNPRPPLLQ